jgi:DNA-directed RNA polymerase specialized sigma24 family protein
MTGNQDVTELLIDWQRGNPAALDQLLPIVYTELHRLARAQLRREQAGHSLQATALVHDVFIANKTKESGPMEKLPLNATIATV